MSREQFKPLPKESIVGVKGEAKCPWYATNTFDAEVGVFCLVEELCSLSEFVSCAD